MTIEPRSGRTRRRTIAAASLTLAVIAPLAACSTDPGTGTDAGDGPVEITFQSWVPNIDQVVDLYNESQDEVEVTLETITAGPDGGYATMLSAVEAGNPADAVQIGYSALPDFAVANALEDITEYVGDSADVFTDWQWQTGVFGDSVYAVPQASGPLVQFYRADIFDELGLDYPETWDDYYAAAQTIRESDRYITAFAFNQAPWMIGLAQQRGAQWFTTEGDSWVVNIDGDETLAVAEFWQRMIDEDLVKVVADFSNEWNSDLQSGEIVTWISGSWADAIVRGTAPETAGSWAVGEMPQWNAGETVSAAWDGGSATAVLRGSEHPEAAADFALWMNSNPESVSLLTSIGAGWPAISDISEISALQDDPEVFDFYGGQNIWEVAARADAAVDTEWQWPPLSSTLYADLVDNVSAAVEAGTPLPEAFEQTQADMVAALEARGIAVAE